MRSNHNELDYLRRREAQERAAAANPDISVARVHRDLADRYADRIRRLESALEESAAA
ncbi:hypothetical protein BH09PSE4_BH09PSE4_23730 [soil metagenome]